MTKYRQQLLAIKLFYNQNFISRDIANSFAAKLNIKTSIYKS